jgi:FtsP/CotA-like multicopper oxidase with cupredoxin domain
MTLHIRQGGARRAIRRHTRRVLVSAIAVSALAGAVLQAGPAAAAPAAQAPAARAAAARAAAAPHAAAAQAAAVGKLTPRGCTQGTGTASCDLYAMAGTTSVLGTTIPIWGFSSTGAAGSATAPGPLLVVHQGDQVAITVHNQLAGENVSLALPGQSAGALSSSGDDTAGVATGGTRTYSFAANRPGTFAYEAGHTGNGSRQVAMGLAGALVVLATDGSAYGAQPNLPATTYDDDGVLVLSEIDPVLNAHPATFDMRNFAPKYRLINGKPYPSSDPISTDQARTVLLRYVNVGSQTHAMSVLGGDQVEIAQDAHQMKYPMTVTAESVVPGATLDTTVKMPSGPESKLAVYEPAGHLDNNGQTTGDPLQLAVGGMLTFLDTNAPQPSSDGVGPVSSHVKATPNPSDARTNVTITADLSDTTTGGSNVSQAEFVVDDAVTTGVGFGSPMTGPFGTVDVAGVSGTIPADVTPCATTGPPTVSLNCLSAGKHAIYVRALDTAGNWGVVGSVIFNLPKTGPQTTNGSVTDTPANGTADVDISATGDDSAAGGKITGAEYFIDTVGANGTGITLALNRSATVVSEDATMTAAHVLGLSEGVHHIYVHSLDSLNLWGPTLDIPLTIDVTGPGVDAASVGPNPSNGIVSDASNPGYALVSAQLTDKDAGGATQSPLVAAEAFLDPPNTTPPGGSGLQLIAVDAKMDTATEAVYGLIPLSQIKALSDGTHHVYVRGEDAAGNWGSLYAVNLVVDKAAPVLGVLTATPNPTNGAANITLSAPVSDASTLATAEYWLGTVDPGVGHASAVPVSIVSGKIVVTVPVGTVPAGTQQFNLRVKDLAGNWSKAISVSVQVVKPNLIFKNGFEVSEPAWSASTGPVSYSAAAAMEAARGMQVTPTTGNRAGYLTDNSPTAEPTYHARFAVNPNNLTSGSAAATVLTLFQATTAANGQVFAVQYHRVNQGTAQVRVVYNRSTGAAVTGNWYTVAVGTNTVLLDWTAGTNGSLKLTINGGLKQTVNGNSNTLRIDTARLGVISGFGTGTSGTGYFDGFSSGRTSAP